MKQNVSKKTVFALTQTSLKSMALFSALTLLAGCQAEIKTARTSTTAAATTSLTDYGLSWDLTTAFPGTGKYSGVTSAVAASSICSTQQFLGSAGTAICSQTYGDLTYSMAFRSDNASFDPMNPGTRTLASLTQETAGTLVANGNSLIPNPHVDTDGRYTDTGIVAKRNYLETVKGRPTIVCGLSGTNAVRIADCAAQNTASGVNKALYEGSKYGQSGESDWKLVTLYSTAGGAVAGNSCNTGYAGGCFEVWRDERTQQIWSDLHSNAANAGWNWFQAAGYAKNATTQADTYYEGGTPAATSLTYDVSQCVNPSLYTCQGNTPISVCADATAIAGTNGVATYQNPDGTNGTYNETPAKGNLTGASRQWRLPTIEDWNIANANGVRKVLPNMDYRFWSASSNSGSRYFAWFFSGAYGGVGNGYRGVGNSVRCVGR